jgi:hypothetical protein
MFGSHYMGLMSDSSRDIRLQLTNSSSFTILQICCTTAQHILAAQSTGHRWSLGLDLTFGVLEGIHLYFSSLFYFLIFWGFERKGEGIVCKLNWMDGHDTSVFSRGSVDRRNSDRNRFGMMIDCSSFFLVRAMPL